jgi:uncharacterized membrane protein
MAGSGAAVAEISVAAAPRGGGDMTPRPVALSKWFGFAGRQLWFDETDIDRLLGPGWAERLTEQIQTTEAGGSGEVRLCVEAALPWADVVRGRELGIEQLIRERASNLFAQLRVWDTENNSGVLFYMLLSERAIEIVVDRGLRRIDARCWQDLAEDTARGLRAGQGLRALLTSLERCRGLLQGAGLPEDSAGNELPDTPHRQ